MPRGRPRKHNPTIPAHIDQSRLPPGIYWDRSGRGRWYVLEDHPEDNRKAPLRVAGPEARLSDLHAIAESRKGDGAKGTIRRVLAEYHKSLKFRDFSPDTKTHYGDYRNAITTYATKLGPLGDQFVDSLGPPVFRKLFDRIAAGDGDTPGYPTKANHWLRYMRAAFNWGIQHDECKTNPIRGVEQVKEKRDHRMPEQTVFRVVQAFARDRGTRGPRDKGRHPPYLWAAMEIAYQSRLRGIEVLTLTDAHDLGAGIMTNRRKGSRDNITRKGTGLTAAVDALRAYRSQVWTRKRREIPLRPQDRFLFVAEDGDPLTRRGFNTAWGKLMRAAVYEGIITREQRFGLHGLKHRGVTDSKGDKKQASGHVTDAMLNVYDHEIPLVEPASDP